MVESEFLRQLVDFDLDRHVGPWVPHNRLDVLPKPIRHWLGYRDGPQKEHHAILQWPITFLATVAGLCLVAGIGNYAPGITAWHPPVIIASLGASAVLDFNAMKSPLAQPRNSVIGNTLAAICGTAIAKLFQLSSNFQNIQWVSGAVGCALASWVMSLTNTIHPPGGATAVLASTETTIAAMGWKYVPIVLLDSCLLVAVACIFNNILGQYPIYWWTPAHTGKKPRQERREEEQEPREQEVEEGKAPGKLTSGTSCSVRTLRRELSDRVVFVDGTEDVHIRACRIELPRRLGLDDEEMMLLEKIQERLRKSKQTANL